MTSFHQLRLSKSIGGINFCGNTARSYNNFILDIILSYLSTSRPYTILDIGCGFGGLGRQLRSLATADLRLIGVELDPVKASIASIFYDDVTASSIDSLVAGGSGLISSADFIVLGDVLEHLTDPWRILRLIGDYAKTSSRIILSIPCITSLDSLVNLIKGRFPYSSDGIFDFTHLRFFGPDDIMELVSLSLSNCRIEKIVPNICPNSLELLQGSYHTSSLKNQLRLGDGLSLLLENVDPIVLQRLATRGLIVVAYHNGIQANDAT